MGNLKELLKAGDHIGHVIAWGVLEGKKAPRVFAQMDVGLSWFGSLAEGRAREITLEALVTMGFNGDDLSDLVKNPNALDKNKDLRLVVEHEPHYETGVLQANIKWVNEVSGGFKTQMDEGSALKALGSMKVKGDLIKIRNEKGVTVSETASPADSEEIPF